MEPLAVSRSDRRWTVRFQPDDRFAAVQCPEWAQSIAREHSQGAHIRLGHVGTSPCVEVVALSRYRYPERSDAVEVAERIAEAVES
ncbi:hypothetical protein [Salinibaculum salinum]|uniref:hypothetical protein n=1 Tax=Salinibaculum salinum TaxID=3131996 RepID=UPI0030EEAD0A